MKTYDELTNAEKLQWLEVTLMNLNEAVVLANAEARILHVNPAWERLTGWSRAEALGKTAGQLMRSDAHPPEFWQQMWADLAAGKTWRGRIISRRCDGAKVSQEVTIIPLGDQAVGDLQLIGMRRDITAQLHQGAEREAHWHKQLLLQDKLTGLPNRTLLYDRLEQTHARLLLDPARHYAVIFFDLDRFRFINDSLGQINADQLLSQIGARLREALPSSHTVARLSGDEFAALIEEPHPDACWALARRLHATFDAPFQIDGQELIVRASAGLALGDRHMPASDVLRNAERAMFRAKQDADGRLVAFDPEMTSLFADRLHREQSLRQALKQQQLTAWFQPQLRLRDGDIVGFEALVRWPKAPERCPSEFVALAEETGLIQALGSAVLDRTCRFAAQHPHVRVAFNLSAVQLYHPEILNDIRAALRRYHLSPARLEIEITETAAMRDAERAVALCQHFRQLGLQLAIDDFGAGYSSLSQLHRLPAQRLKIDRSFIQNLGGDRESLAIVRSILGLARSLGLETVAEGIETTEQLQILREEGCDLGQGWLFSAALPSAQAAAMCVQSLRA
ncbi:MAG: EAL domain-containing protein [Spirulinaceae cyanobacterium RM2_2_10]|nr:EAL domain-containing protein [Spirulinaceae cyanobacterium SM2_1_0]NJO19833.1 EAL domain-containing protein [Spirulinaceae cyanobacterium RM2_2_10]